MKKYLTALSLLALSINACADTVSTSLYFTEAGNSQTKPIGQVIFSDSPYGLLIQPKLYNLPPGLHGFHLHQHADCGEMGHHAGGHFDPLNTNNHLGPYLDGHLGDLPALYIDQSGNGTLPTLAPRLRTSDIHHLALMIHAGGDNYSDDPPLGGGGARLGCGVID